MKKNLALAISLVTILAGCSSVNESRYAAIPISARPAGSQVTISCAEGTSATTQSQALLPSGSEAAKCAITVSHPGYEPASAIVTRIAGAKRPSSDPVRVVLNLEPEHTAASAGR